jgi:hypothetical protein
MSPVNRLWFSQVSIVQLLRSLFRFTTLSLHLDRMHFTRTPRLFGLATFVSSISAGVAKSVLEQRDPNSVCESFGIDFQDGGSYFINQASTEQFQAVSQFEGGFV